MRLLSPCTAAMLALAGIPAASASDSFSGAPTLAINSQTSFNTTNATKEPGEPIDVAQHTVWYRYVAPTRGIVRLDLSSSMLPGSINLGHSILHVYQGNALGKLVLVTSARNSSLLNLTFPSEAGAEFRICISDSSATIKRGGTLTIQQSSWPHGSAPLVAPLLPTSEAPTNDDFATPRIIPSGPSAQTILGYNTSATQSGFGPEPTSTGYRSLWYRWVAPRRGIARITTQMATGVGYAHGLTVYRGNSITALNSIDGQFVRWSWENVNFNFPVEAGVEYRICFGGYDQNEHGPFVFNLGLEAWPYGTATIIPPRMPVADVPRNDLLEGATPLTSKRGKYTVLDYNQSATTGTAPLEPAITGYRSLWYRWTAPESSYVQFSTPGYQTLGYYHTLVAFSGSTSNLKQEAYLHSNISSRMGFYATKGRTYYISFGLYSDRTTIGDVIFTYESGPQVNTTGPKCKFTNLKKNLKVSKNGFYIQGSIANDPEGLKNLQIKVGTKQIYSGAISSLNFSIISGKVKKGNVKIQVRAQDGFGRWGNWTAVTVKAS